MLSGRVQGSETEAAKSDDCLASDSLRVKTFQGEMSDASQAVESSCYCFGLGECTGAVHNIALNTFSSCSL